MSDPLAALSLDPEGDTSHQIEYFARCPKDGLRVQYLNGNRAVPYVEIEIRTSGEDSVRHLRIYLGPQVHWQDKDGEKNVLLHFWGSTCTQFVPDNGKSAPDDEIGAPYPVAGIVNFQVTIHKMPTGTAKIRYQEGDPTI